MKGSEEEKMEVQGMRLVYFEENGKVELQASQMTRFLLLQEWKENQKTRTKGV